jgi:hypothetical protein
MTENYQSFEGGSDMTERAREFLSECQGKKDSVFIVNSAGCFDSYADMTEFITECDKQGASEHIIDVLNDALEETDWSVDSFDY